MTLPPATEEGFAVLWEVGQRKEYAMTKPQKDQAAAMRDGKKPGPKDSPVQVRNAGAEAQADRPKKWDKVDEAVDESFPASDASAKY